MFTSVSLGTTESRSTVEMFTSLYNNYYAYNYIYIIIIVMKLCIIVDFFVVVYNIIIITLYFCSQ